MRITEKQLSIASVASIVGLLSIWVVPNTIALRHVFLVVGFLSGIGLIRYHWLCLKSASFKVLPLFCIFSLFIWVLIHYLFFSLNPELELSEIKGVWMRSMLGAVAAVGLGIAIVRNSSLRICFYIALFSTPLINVSSYLWASYLNHAWVRPNDFVRFLFTKIETAYFGAIAAGVATGSLIHLLMCKMNRTSLVQIFAWLLGLALVLVSALVSSTKNGIAVAIGLCVFLAIVVLITSILHKGGSKALSAVVLIIIVSLSVGIWKGHKSSAYKGWDTVFEDAALGLDIDTNKQWQKREGTVPTPLNSTGSEAAINTYIRFSYMAVGASLIKEYPLGYGSINRSFKGLQVHAKVPHEHEGQVHSGWIDFGLAFGIPGLLLIFSSMLLIIYFGIKDKSSLVLPWAIVCLALIPFGIIAEITWKQYFEATIFFLTVGSTVVIFAGNKSKDMI